MIYLEVDLLKQSLAPLELKRPIGLLDSGVGGLTVVKELIQQLSNEQLIYFGDTVHFPYGPRDLREVKGFAIEIAKFLLEQGVKAIIVACNTASAAGLEELKREIAVPIIGVIEPVAQAAVNATKNGRVGIIGTVGTINSNAHKNAIKSCMPEIEVFGQPCPLFVNLVEEGKVDEKETWEVAEYYLKPLKEAEVDVLILGCTHFPHLRPVISKVMGDKVTLLDPAEETVKAVARILGKEGRLNYGKKADYDRYWVTAQPEKFQQVGQKLLNIPLQVKMIKFWPEQRTEKCLEAVD